MTYLYVGFSSSVKEGSILEKDKSVIIIID